jgi:multiple sugar transport system substrate-binding protein
MRRLTRQQFLLMSAGAGAGFVLAGCGGGGPQNNPAVQGQGGSGSGGTEYTGPTVELAFWNGFTGGDGPFMRELVDQFSAEHENIQVSMSTQEWEDYYESVPAAVRGGSGPDVGIMHSDQLGTNAARGVILPLDDVAESLGWRSPTSRQRCGTRGSTTVSVSASPGYAPLALYYNKTLLEQAGLDPNSPPQTRDDYEAALEELKSSGIQGSWVSPFPFTGTLQFESLLWQFGGDLYNEDVTRATFNSDAGVEALTWMVDLVQNDYSPSDVAQDAEFIAFQNGENAFPLERHLAAHALKEVEDLDLGVAPLPQIGSENAACRARTTSSSCRPRIRTE